MDGRRRGLTYQRRQEPSCLPVGTARGPLTRGLKAGQQGHFLVSLLPHPAPVLCPQARSHRDPPASPSGRPPRLPPAPTAPGAPGARPRGDAFLTRPPPRFCPHTSSYQCRAGLAPEPHALPLSLRFSSQGFLQSVILNKARSSSQGPTKALSPQRDSGSPSSQEPPGPASVPSPHRSPFPS